MTGYRRNLCAALTLCVGSVANAQTGSIEDLERNLRDARVAALKAERALLDARITAIETGPPFADGSQRTAPAIPSTVSSSAATGSVTQSPPKDKEKGAALVEDTPPTVTDKGKYGLKTFGGLDLGVGLSFTLDVGKHDRISRASVTNGVVRVDDQDNGRARLMLESHYFFTPCRRFLFGLKNPCTWIEDPNGRVPSYWQADPKTARWGIGPFVAIQAGSDDVIDAIGMGLMVGARRELSGQSFNLGVGLVLDPNTRVLGEGIKPDQPLPLGETEVRYRETLQTGLLILTSFSF